MDIMMVYRTMQYTVCQCYITGGGGISAIVVIYTNQLLSHIHS